ncbi:hypothetical protein GCM10027046_39440 [Uliginosibacterium flavum]|uniref:DUF7668 domain-containing protein n=1 Tax=Uliginosibacterium flavum TaxID=1396831 RepID=A0ABV2TKL2_9RHOO
MTDLNGISDVSVVKDEEHELPVPSIWRPVFRSIVSAFAKQDYQVDLGVLGVLPITSDTANQIDEYIQDYGETLIELPEDTWETSVCIWMGTRWDVLIDLWTEGEGRSDMILSAKVSESSSGFVFEVYMVYVP